MKRSTKPLAVDGSAIDAILDLAGAPKKSAATARAVSELESALGKPLATETKKFLERPVTLTHPHVDVSYDFFGALPDVARWIDELGTTEGFLQSVQHFLGLYPIGAQLQYGDTMIALVVLEPYTKNGALGGVMYYDDRETGTWGASISAFLLQSLAKYCEEAGGDESEPRDCFVFEKVDANKPPPPAAKIPAPIAKAWDAHWRWRLERSSRWWIAQFLRGDDPKRFLRALPTEKIWNAEKRGVASTHHEGMYWLLAHWLLDNGQELAEAAALAKKNPSKLVSALAAFVTKNTPSAKQKKLLDALLEAVRLAT